MDKWLTAVNILNFVCSKCTFNDHKISQVTKERLSGVSLQTDVVHCMTVVNQIVAIAIVSTCGLFTRQDTVDIGTSLRILPIPHESHVLPFIQLKVPTKQITLISNKQIQIEILVLIPSFLSRHLRMPIYGMWQNNIISQLPSLERKCTSCFIEGILKF